MDKPLHQFQNKYEKFLEKSTEFKKAKLLAITLPLIVVAILTYTILPSLPKKVIGKPDSDWLMVGLNATETKSARQMENLIQEYEDRARTLLGDKVDYTWVEMHDKRSGQMMFKLKNRKDMTSSQKIINENFINNTKVHVWVDTWNPAELPLPREWHYQATISGENDLELLETASRLKYLLNEGDFYDRLREEPGGSQNFAFQFDPYLDIWKNLAKSGQEVSLSDIADISKLSVAPFSVGRINLEKNKTAEIQISMSDERYQDPELLSTYPIKLANKVIPLAALGSFKTVKTPGKMMVRDGQKQIQLFGKITDDPKDWEDKRLDVEAYVQKNMAGLIKNTKATIVQEYPQMELKDSLTQLAVSLATSLALIFIVLWMQFQSVKQVLIIMMTIPLGISGVLVSLKVFGSYLSLNSTLGIILLNGITVNNSILLTDVVNTLRKQGLRGKELIVAACSRRLRPIIITSLTTMLGMFPVALGLGDGGKIMQPLGIAVTCGLLVATSLTLIVVPILLYQKEDPVLETSPTRDDEIEIKPILPEKKELSAWQ